MVADAFSEFHSCLADVLLVALGTVEAVDDLVSSACDGTA